jgi:predicted GIY-YIG superfamily endonuclease
MKRKDAKSEIFIYVLRLEYGMIYVGQTTDVERRIKAHRKGVWGVGSAWTYKYKPLDLIEVRPTGCFEMKEAIKIENEITCEYIQKFGWMNVRGGDYCKLSDEAHRWLLTNHSLFTRELCPIYIECDCIYESKIDYIFTLRLEHNKYYVGRTNHLPLAVLNEYNGLGGYWNIMHKPLALIEALRFNNTDKNYTRQLHNQVVIKAMETYGANNIRGGDYYKIDTIGHFKKVVRNTSIIGKIESSVR